MPRRGALVPLLALLAAALPGARAAADEFETLQKRLIAAVDADRAPEIADGVRALAATGDPRAVRTLVIVGERYPEDPVRTSVQEALAGRSEDGWVAALGEQLRAAGSDAAAVVVIEALGAIDHAGTAAPLCDALGAHRPNVLVVALRAARHKRDKILLPPLIDLLERSEAEQGLLWAETRIALQSITGERFKIAEDWRRWFRSRPDDWRPQQPSGAEEKEKTSVYRPEGEDGGAGLPKIFGQEVASKRVVFVIDCSQSMEKIDETAREEGSKGPAGPTRLARAQRELIGAIEELRPDVLFNVVAYSTNVTVWNPEKLVPAKKNAKSKATAFVGSLKPEGHTNTADALLTAMDLPEVDTIIFLSDGSPTIPGKGEMAEIPPILESIFVANRTKNITIHTHGFQGALVSFMRAIAAGTGGTYSQVK